jgi:hypothetical protein
MDKPLLVKVGARAFVDTFAGLLPCRVIAVRGGTGKPEQCTSKIRCDVRLTKTRGAYKKGEVLSDYPSYRIVPPGAVRVTKLGLYRISNNYQVQSEVKS